MITARQAVPGTTVKVESTAMTLTGVKPWFAWVTVDHWHGNGDGTAGLVDTRGQWCGIYGPDHLFETRDA